MRNYVIFFILVLMSCKPRDNVSKSGTKDLTQQQESINDSLSIHDKDDKLLNFYFQIIESLAQNNSRDAAKSGNDMAGIIAIRLSSAMPSDTIAEILTDAKRHAEHIGENAKDIHHQREHLVFLSKDILDLVHILKPEMSLYKVSCEDGKEFWISTDENLNDPYSDENRNCKPVFEKI